MARKRPAAEVKSFIDQEIFGGTPNDEILASLPGYKPSPASCDSLHIYERPREVIAKSWPWVRGYRMRPLTFTACVRMQAPLHRNLPPAATQAGLHDVYMVVRPGMHARFLTRSVYHWSVYCDGHFYHIAALSIPGVSGPPRPILVSEDLSDPSTPSFRARANRPGIPLLAYHVGQTRYSPTEIQHIANWIREGLSQYNFFSSNCQHFAMCLLVRIVNRDRLCRVFLGRALQLMAWDSRQKTSLDSGSSGFSVGFELSRPREYKQPPNLFRRYNMNRRIDFAALRLGQLWPQGAQGLIADDALHCSAWRRELCLPLYTDRFPSWRARLLRPDPQSSCNLQPGLPPPEGCNQCRSIGRQIADCPEGFESENVYWAMRENRSNHQGLEDFLSSGDENPEKCYDIGIAYLKPQHHAVVVLKSCDAEATLQTDFATIYEKHTNGDLPHSGIRRLDIRFPPGATDRLVLKLATPRKKLEFSRYHELYRVRTTERRLRHIALQSCPERHRYMIGDCATFVFNFLAGVLCHLESRGAIRNIEPYIQYLISHNHVSGGTFGPTETGSRRYRVLGKSGYLVTEWILGL
ncbi:hypothetical protein GGR56DRAFT_218696 [Xylariaceae sp. FL0804]|nr:hypothetical protein GGR56DRAFT_218696 [Xylariaceae sp. FL0804]